ncbi:MAG TPA: hypothetical protein VI522_06935, partial [Gammaproteobacteria bacterium]|nr:hypothetical protein [Gammaproteobacteria bacterium]
MDILANQCYHADLVMKYKKVKLFTLATASVLLLAVIFISACGSSDAVTASSKITQANSATASPVSTPTQPATTSTPTDTPTVARPGATPT